MVLTICKFAKPSLHLTFSGKQVCKTSSKFRLDQSIPAKVVRHFAMNTLSYGKSSESKLADFNVAPAHMTCVGQLPFGDGCKLHRACVIPGHHTCKGGKLKDLARPPRQDGAQESEQRMQCCPKNPGCAALQESLSWQIGHQPAMITRERLSGASPRIQLRVDKLVTIACCRGLLGGQKIGRYPTWS